jgi:hypothetical protein
MKAVGTGRIDTNACWLVELSIWNWWKPAMVEGMIGHSWLPGGINPNNNTKMFERTTWYVCPVLINSILAILKKS